MALTQLTTELIADGAVTAAKIASSAASLWANATTAGEILVAGGWGVTPRGTNLYFVYNGVNKGKLDSSGNFTVIGNVTAYGTV